MSHDRIQLTREELYELVWIRPVQQLAAEFGLSDVGFAKMCRRHGIPRPGRGYWASLAAGRKPRRMSLPKAPSGALETIELERRPRLQVERRPDRDVPTVSISKDLRGAHEVTRQLNKLLDKKPYGNPPMLVLRGPEVTAIRVSPEAKGRALLALDSLFRAIEERGHRVCLTITELTPYRHIVRPHAVVWDATVAIALIEKTGQKPRVVAREERERRSFLQAPIYDHFTTGVLSIELDRRPYGHGARFADGKKHRLEDRLGSIVLAIEDQAQSNRRMAEASKVAAERAEAERQRVEAESRQRAHLAALGNELRQMADRWAEVTRVTAFLDAYEARVPEAERTDMVRGWIEWARAFSVQNDPLTHPERIAKRLQS